MSITKQEREELVARYRDKAWAYVLKLEQERGRVLNMNQIRCMNIALGLTT